MTAVFNQRPGAAAVGGAYARTTAMNGVPVILAPNATWTNTTGAFSLSVDLPQVYSAAWVRFSANGVNGSTGGPAASLLYWCTFTSKSAGQAYTLSADPAQPFTPYFPTDPLVPLPTVAGAHAQIIGADVTMLNLTVAGSTMGPRGATTLNAMLTLPNTARNKNFRVNFGGQSFFNATIATGAQYLAFLNRIVNRGVTNSQVGTASNMSSGIGASANLPTIGNIDTTIDQQLLVTFNLASGADYIVLEAFSLDVTTA